MSFILVSLLTLLISLSAFGAGVEAKPLNQNSLRFRRLPPKEFSAALGSFITIQCDAAGSPPPTIHWLKNGKRIHQSDFVDQLEDSESEQLESNSDRIATSLTKSRLFIDCASYQDEAVYTCVAQTAFSRISTHTKFSLIRPLAESARTGSDENDLLSGPINEVSELELASANAMKQLDSGDAEQAAAEASKEKSIAAIPVCLSQRNTRAAEPIRIHMWSHNMLEMQSNDAILYCRSNAKRHQVVPLSSRNNNRKQQQEQSISNTDLISYNSNGKQAQLAAVAASKELTDDGSMRRTYVSWTLNNEKQLDGEQKSKYEILETGDLWIKNLTWSDVGSYVCTVSDEQSADSVTTLVYPAAMSKVNKRASLNNRLGDFR